MAQMKTRWRAAVALMLVAGPVVAQQPPAGLGDSVTVIPGTRYAKGGLYRLVFGTHYRNLWTTPIRVPILDLSRFAGGLTPLKEGGGQQTKSLRFLGADGRQYAFRSVDKDPSVVLPPGLRETFADRILQDQISAGHPLGALAVPPILEAAGVLHATPIVVKMPDAPALGEFRTEFAGMLGLLEERPRDADDEGMSFAGASKIVSTDDLYSALDDRPETQVDARAFLAARLTDVFLGDWDRHRDQWRWALLERTGAPRWYPIPRDRDQAFVRFDGVLLTMVRKQVPQLVDFGPKYPAIVGASWNGRDLDRRFLTGLELPVWDSVAAALTRQFTDEVLDRAVAALPREQRTSDGARLRAGLAARRDGLQRMARNYYRLLAGEVEVVASDRADVVTAERREGGLVMVSVRQSGRTAPYFERTFHPAETSDIRIYLHGGADSAIVTGGGGGTTVRIIGGGGDDQFIDRSSGPTKFYDARGENAAEGGSINARPYQAIDDITNPTALPHRDWGRRTLSFPAASLGPDVGLVLGYGATTTSWGFRKKPFASAITYQAAVATGGPTGRAQVAARFQAENSSRYFSFQVIGSGIEVVRWHGFGNDRPIDPALPVEFYRATQHQLVVAPSVGWALGDRIQLEAGPRFKYAVTEIDDGINARRFIGTNRPFGISGIAQLGGGFELKMDSRDTPAAARRGVLVEAGGAAYPALLDIKRGFGELHGRVATYLSPAVPLRPTLALQAGAKKVFGASGQIPFYEAAFLGSGTTLRGFRSQRFAGDGSVFGTAELRLELTRATLLVPGRQGVFGFYDGGRVYLEGESSSTWHESFGGGLWLSFLTPGTLISAAIGTSEEGSRLHLRAGFAF